MNEWDELASEAGGNMISHYTDPSASGFGDQQTIKMRQVSTDQVNLRFEVRVMIEPMAGQPSFNFVLDRAKHINLGAFL